MPRVCATSVDGTIMCCSSLTVLGLGWYLTRISWAVRAVQGLEANARKEVWKFLLGYFPWGSTEAERQKLRLAKRCVRKRPRSLACCAILTALIQRSCHGRLVCTYQSRSFSSFFDPREEYHSYKKQWQSVTPAQEARFHKFRDRKHRIGGSCRQFGLLGDFRGNPLFFFAVCDDMMDASLQHHRTRVQTNR